MPGPFAILLKRTAAEWPLVASLFTSVLLAATLVAAAPIYADATARGGLEALLREAPPADSGVEVVRRVDAGEYADATADVRAAVAAAFGEQDVEPVLAAESSSYPLEGAAGDLRGVLAFVDGLAQGARVVEGRLPRTAGGGPVEAAIPAPAAEAAGLEVGDLVRLGADEGPEVRVVGVLEVDPAARVWWGDALALTGVRGRETVTVGPFLTTRETLLGRVDDVRASWRASLDPSGLELDRLDERRSAVLALGDRLNETADASSPYVVTTGLPGLLEEARETIGVARSGVLVPVLQLALLAGYSLVFTATLLGERRARERTLLRARGADTRQLAVAAVLEGLAVAVPAALLAPTLAVVSLQALDAYGPLASAGLELQPRTDTLPAVLAAATALACAALLALPALRGREEETAPARRPRAGLVRRSGLDLALLVLALVALWQLRRYGSPLVEGDGRREFDPVLVAAPALGLFAGAVLASRVFPAAASALERATRGRRGLPAALVARRLSRASGEYVRPALLLIMAVGIGAFAAAYSSTWLGVQEDRAALAAGSDVLVEPSRRSDAFPAAGLAQALAALPGVERAVPIAHDEVPFEAGRESVQLVAVDAAGAAEIARPELRPALERLAATRPDLPAVPIPGEPEALRVVATAHLRPIPAGDRPPFQLRFGFRPATFEELSAALSLVVRDRTGLIRRLPPVPLARPGEPLELTVPLVPEDSEARPAYPLDLVAAELTTLVPEFVPRRLDVQLERIEAGGRSVPLSTDWQASVRGLAGAVSRPAVELEAAGAGVLLELLTGGTFRDRDTVTATLRPPGEGRVGPLAALAGTGLLDTLGASVGDTVELDLGEGRRSVRIIGSAETFPTVTADGGDRFVALDLPSLAAARFADRRPAVEPDAWLLDVAPGEEEAVAALLRSPPLQAEAVVSREALERRLSSDPLAVATGGALWLGFGAAALFALTGFVLASAARLRAHAVELAALRALGLGRDSLTRTLVAESAVVVALGVVLGAALGLALAELVLPAAALTETGERPVPRPTVDFPWTTVGALALGLAVVLLASSWLQARGAARTAPAQLLRSSEAA